MKFIRVIDPKYPDTYINIETITHIEPIREGVSKIYCNMKINHYLLVPQNVLMDYLTSNGDAILLEAESTYDYIG